LIPVWLAGLLTVLVVAVAMFIFVLVILKVSSTPPRNTYESLPITAAKISGMILLGIGGVFAGLAVVIALISYVWSLAA